MADKRRTQLLVVGGGPGGYAAAFLAADLGMQVTLVDPALNPGGVCLYRGCIPSKALLHVADLLDETERSAEWGVTFQKPKIDLKKLRSWKTDVVEKLTGGLGVLTKQRKIEHVRGTAVFVSGNQVDVSLTDGGAESIVFDHAILASGSSPTRLPHFPEDERIWDSTAALELKSIPKKLLVVGGGYIGLELGSVYAALGSKVTVVEATPTLLPGADRDLVRPLAQKLEGALDEILLETMVTEAAAQKNGIKIKLEGAAAGDRTSRMYDAVLVSIGRRPNSKGLGLENTRVVVDDKGFVQADETLRTAEPTIYAIGDVIGQPMLAHKASHEGRIAVEAIAGHKVAFEPNAIPAVVFTDPEIAWAGLTETEAKERGIKVQISRFPWGASGRATTLGRGDGVTKLLADPETERVLGVGICGPGAGELIAEGVLAIEMAATVKDIALTIHPHPTLSETVMESAEVFFGQSTHVYRPKRTAKNA